jgi:GntR family transcriptional regulator, transcriptional repressor for pyruvate dehydrogenase complex
MLNEIEVQAAPADVASIIAAIRQLQVSGAPLPSERELADRLLVKRHQLRKALEALRQSGDLKPARARRDATTAQPRYGEELVRVTNPLEVAELRLIMEPSFARLASLRASAHDIAHILEAAATPQGAESGAADLAFHLSIATAARNHLAVEFFKMLRQVGVDARIRVARISPPTCPIRIAQHDGEHRLIAEAIAQRDPEAAEAAMRAHLLLVQRRIMERSNTGLAAA